MKIRPFGTMPSGELVEEVVLSGRGLSASILTYGAVIRDLVIQTASGPRRVVLGLADLDAYRTHGNYLGAVAGRFANRIAGGQFTLDGTTYELDRNEAGQTTLHGGSGGFSGRVWSVVSANAESVELTLVSPDGDQGFPGRLEARCRYRITGDRQLTIELIAQTGAPTIVNLATHSYFNLAIGAPDAEGPIGDILDHRLQVAGRMITPVDGRQIPTGEFLHVNGTDYDFRSARPVRRISEGERVAYDHNFVVAQEARSNPVPVARLEAPEDGLALEISSTEPGLQVYDGSYLPPSIDQAGRSFGGNAGICLEPQRFPDSPNQPAFPSVVLHPGETYRQVTIYDFPE